MLKPILAKLQGKKILIAPLDWGLGHTTRCIPIIYELVNQGCEVVIAVNDPHKAILAQEFPQLQFISIPNYNIAYGKSKIGTIIKLAKDYTRIKKVITTETAWLKKVVPEYDIEAIISDNRYGLYHSTIPSYFITHQLFIKSSLLNMGEKFMQKQNYSYINRFSECWVPDVAGVPNFAGDLSHPKKMPAVPVQYLGVLTRFHYKETPAIYKAAIILSGPEPQRTILENSLLKQIATCTEKIVLIRGLPDDSKKLIIPNKNIVVHNYTHTNDLNEIVLQSERIICRSGYTSVMDYLSLQKKCIFIPTPGQGEQEYLAQYLPLHHNCIAMKQHQFSLTTALQF